MTDERIADHYRRVARQFTAKAEAVASTAWDNPAPCEGWVARDVIRHMIEWLPGFLSDSGIVLAHGPSVDEDPLGAWTVFSDGIQKLLDDPVVASIEFTHPYVGPQTFERAVNQFFTPDVFLHAWDLARATGVDETLDPAEVHALFVGMEPIDEMLRGSGQYGPRVPVADDADEQTKLIAFIGRKP
jgi:uncharacterized protein (TIGR03086 family)